jgi:hypothetical protein
MSEKASIKLILAVVLLLFVLLGITYAETGNPIIVTSLTVRDDGKASFFHKDLFSWHEQIQEQIDVLHLNAGTPERVKDVRRNGHCFKTGECQKEITISLPIESLSHYHRFILLSTDGTTIQIKPDKIEGSALMMVYPDGKVITKSAGYGDIYLRSDKTKFTDRYLVFALPQNDNQLVITRMHDTETTRRRTSVDDHGLIVDGKTVIAKNNTSYKQARNITIPFEVSISNRSERFIALSWAADTPCERNFSLIRVDSSPEEYQWLGWQCDL